MTDYAAFKGAIPSTNILQAAAQSRSPTMHFGAATFDGNGKLLSYGWNGRPTNEELKAAPAMVSHFQKLAIAKGFLPESVSLISGTGFRRAIHAEGRAILRLFMAARVPTDVLDIALMQVVVLFPDNKHYGVKKIEETGIGRWSTCSKCTRLMQIIGAKEQMLTPRGWNTVDPAETFTQATTERVAPLGFWDKEKDLVAATIRQNRSAPLDRIDTPFMTWRRLPEKIQAGELFPT